MQIATWNVNGLKARMPRVTGWLEANRPDVLCIQETKQSDAAFFSEEFRSLGYDSVHFGQGQWNGVAVLSRVGLEDPVAGFGSEVDELGARLAAATCAGVRVHSVYVPNGRSLDSEHYAAKLRWLAALGERLASTCRPDDPVVVCGDFNIAPEDRDVWDVAALEGMTHVSPPERAALAEIEAWGLEDTFRHEHDDAGVFSWWDYRAGAFHKGMGMRIDLVLATAPLIAGLTSARIDREARKGPKPSDHAPVIAEFDR